tara:strand:- start:118 stop:621 length:504 start_codon:yes stop_codon:yes gene_type:complete
MKKVFLILTLLPAFSFADNVSFVGADYFRVSGYGESGDGYQISVMSVFNAKTSVNLSHAEISEYGIDISMTTLNVEYAFGSFDDGSFYAGIGGVDGEGISEPAFTLGYSKRSGQGLDYDIGLSTVDGETAFGATLRGEIGGNGLGWHLGAASDGDVSTQTVGLNFKF